MFVVNSTSWINVELLIMISNCYFAFWYFHDVKLSSKMNQYCGQCLSLAAWRPTICRHGIIARRRTLWRRGVRPPQTAKSFWVLVLWSAATPGAMVRRHGFEARRPNLRRHGNIAWRPTLWRRGVRPPKRLSPFCVSVLWSAADPGVMVWRHGFEARRRG
jgi:hypothetical protein